MKIAKMLALLTFVWGCSSVQTINLQNQDFRKKIKKIVWLQVPGLQEEHLAMLRFYGKDSDAKTPFEKSICLGKTWNYNLFKIRPSSSESFMSQMTGRRDITNSCSDFEKNFFQNQSDLISQKSFVGFLEFGVDEKDSLAVGKKCSGQKKNFSNAMAFWKMKAAPRGKKSNRFHFQQKIELAPKVYYDKSCKGSTCFSSLFGNAKAIWNQVKNEEISTFIIRDDTYLKNLIKQDMKAAKESLLEIQELMAFFQNQTIKNKELLVLLSSASSYGLELPNKGKDWIQFEKTGQNILYKKQSLLSPLFAHGAQAQNMCGIYEESEVAKRLIWTSENRNVLQEIFK